VGAFIGESYRVESPSRIISVAKTKSYLLQALKGLERLHFAGIIHRDIKPFNLMITSDDRIKIIDFGLSRVRGEEKMAIPGMQVGSPYYAAPEQEKNPKNVDGRADLYSLGVLAYRMLTGNLFDYHHKEIAPVSSVNSGVTSEWDQFVTKAISRSPEDRFPSCQEMRRAMEKLPMAEEPVVEEGMQQFHDLAPLPSRLRSEPRRVMYKEIRGQLDLDDLFHPSTYHIPQFQAVGPLVAYEKRSGLYWQRRGAGFTVDWQGAKDYVAYLNDMRWEGKNNWRLPTLEELRTVLSPPRHGVECSTWPLLDSTIHWLWSSDHCTRKQAWMVDVVESFFDRLDRDGVASVCAVSAGSA